MPAGEPASHVVDAQWHPPENKLYLESTTVIYKFKSQAAGNLIMLEPNGRQLLGIIGKHAGPQGIILPEEMEDAIHKLQQAVERAEAAPPAPGKQSGDKDGYGNAAERDVSLRQRVVPFVHMLRECRAAGKEIVWGV